MLASVEKKLEQIPFPLQVVMPDGSTVGDPNFRVRLVVKDFKSLARVASGNIGHLAEDYVEGRVGLDGNMRDVMAAAQVLLPHSPIDGSHAHWLASLFKRGISMARHTIDRDAKQIEFHYDLSDDFYALWLDPRRVYSCAYYPTPKSTLAQAQEAKLDLICRKLRLREGERFLDIGAGWGGLLLWAAENYGVDATGITLSRNQHAYVNRLIEERGLSGRVRMLLQDYRTVEPTQPWDKIASVGMFEHVGRARLDSYFTRVRNLLRPGGLVMNHGITAGGTRNTQLGAGMGDFIEKYIFPGGELVHVGQVMESVTNGGLEAVDVENLRPHYARTLWAWSDGLEAQLEAAHRILPGEQGEKAIRAYRLYLAGCAMSFEHGWISLHQVLCQTLPTGASNELDEPADREYPFRRDYMYQPRLDPQPAEAAPPKAPQVAAA
ncbi:SAM-dependent methyltransferase [Verticiella sediminum]|nr:cyclopropane-fatty-acyl-phospholipid synthase family protein [Verticiella sediminum]